MRRNEISGSVFLILIAIFIVWMFWKAIDNNRLRHVEKNELVIKDTIHETK